MLGDRLRQWLSITPTLGQHLRGVVSSGQRTCRICSDLCQQWQPPSIYRLSADWAVLESRSRTGSPAQRIREGPWPRGELVMQSYDWLDPGPRGGPTDHLKSGGLLSTPPPPRCPLSGSEWLPEPVDYRHSAIYEVKRQQLIIWEASSYYTVVLHFSTVAYLLLLFELTGVWYPMLNGIVLGTLQSTFNLSFFSFLFEEWRLS